MSFHICSKRFRVQYNGLGQRNQKASVNINPSSLYSKNTTANKWHVSKQMKSPSTGNSGWHLYYSLYQAAETCLMATAWEVFFSAFCTFNCLWIPNKLFLKVLSISKPFGGVYVHSPKETKQNNSQVMLDMQLSTAQDLSCMVRLWINVCCGEAKSFPPFPSALELGLAAMLFLPSLLTSSATTESFLYWSKGSLQGVKPQLAQQL